MTMHDIRKLGTDICIGIGGVVTGLSFQTLLAGLISFSTLLLIWLRIYLLWKNRNKPPKE